MPKNIESYSGGALNEDERREVRRMLENHRRARWLWGSLQRLIIAIGAVAAAITAVKVFIWEWFK